MGVPLEEMDAVFGEGTTKFIFLVSFSLINTPHKTNYKSSTITKSQSKWPWLEASVPVVLQPVDYQAPPCCRSPANGSMVSPAGAETGRHTNLSVETNRSSRG